MCGLGDAGELKAGLLVTAEVGECVRVTEIGWLPEHRDERQIPATYGVGAVRSLCLPTQSATA
jgi:hypothetical protein